MAVLGSPNYRVGLIVAKAQPFHNGHLKIITDALMQCDEVIFSVRDYDKAFFDYNIAQKVFRKLYNLADRIAFFGTRYDPLLGTPKHVINRTLDDLKAANYHMPTHFFTSYDMWVEPAKELQLETIRVSTLPDHVSNDIYNSVTNKTDLWKSKVPYSVVEELETYIATKNRNSI
jgi:cytidyltransferase-like protein